MQVNIRSLHKRFHNISVAYCLMFLNCCVNPIALYFLSKSFKNHYMRQLCCSRRSGSSETDLGTKQSQLADSQAMSRFNRSKVNKHEHTDETDGSANQMVNRASVS